MTGQAWIIFRKELLETLRDRRTLAIMIVVPVLLYPALLVLTEQLALFGLQRLEAEAVPVAVSGDPWPELEGFLGNTPGLQVQRIQEGGDPAEELRSDRLRAVVQVTAGSTPPRVHVLFDAADERSQRARTMVGEALRGWRDTLVVRGLDRQGVDPVVLRPLAVADSSVALPSEVGGYTLGRFLPMLLVFMTLLGAFYPAIDLAAGEKERGTLEALLTVPVPAGNLVAGKFMAVATVGTLAAALNLASMLLTFRTGLFRFGDLAAGDIGLSAGTVGVIFLAIVPLAVLFGALFLGIAVRSRSFKEAQNSLTPVYLGVLIPSLLPILPGMQLTPLLAVIPVAGTTLLIRDALAGSVGLTEAVMALSSTVAWAALALYLAARSFGSEGVLFGVSGERRGPGEEEVEEDEEVPARVMGPLPRPAQAGFFIAGVAVLFFYGGRIFPSLFGEAGLMVAQVTLLLVPALVFVALGRFDIPGTLSLGRPSAKQLAAGVLVILGGLPVAWMIAWLQSFVLPLPEGFLEAMSRMLDAEGAGRVLWLLLLVAVTPALCEEVVFRGVLLGGTRELGARRAIALNALVFGAFHLSFESAFRLLPTLWLGVLLASVVWYTRSLWVGMLMHFVNNGTIVLLSAVPFLRERMGEPGSPPPLWLLPAGVLLLAWGIRMLAGASPVRDPGSRDTLPAPADAPS